MRWRRCYNGYQLMNSKDEVIGTLWKDRGTWYAGRADAYGYTLDVTYHDYFIDAKATLAARVVAHALENT